MKECKICLIVFLLLTAWFSAKGQTASLRMDHQLSSWLGLNFSKPVNWQTGARYIPSLYPSLKLNENSKIDAELSANTYGSLFLTGFRYDSAGFSIKPYRLWLRYSTSHLEIRAGLQKINFGSAYIFRPLMWFDKIDYRDPLQITDGVYGLLGRYYFNNNMTVWLWTLYGNKKTKGWEAVPSAGKIPEYGGRFQFPAGKGELALSYHNRVADYSGLIIGLPITTDSAFTEQMFALDGKWDLGIGLWFEYVGKMNDKRNVIKSRWETYFSLGFDYTFPVGKGLNIISEYFRYENKPGDDEQKIKNNFSTLSLNYPFFMSHTLSGLVYYNWDTGEWYRFLNLQLKYDYLSLYFMAFWNPDKSSLYYSDDSTGLFAGKGIQIMFVIDI